MSFERVSLRAVADMVSRLMKPLFDKRSIAFELDLPESELSTVCDRDKIQEVLINLLDNAAKNTPEKGRVHFALSASGESIRFEVDDTGIGIRKDDHEKIFEMFGKAQHGLNRAPGAGIGLAICRMIAEFHRGRLWVESAPGRGSRFIFTFPTNLPARRKAFYQSTLLEGKDQPLPH